MGLLLLLTSFLLSSYFHADGVVNAQRLFTIRNITLSIEPSTHVTRDTNVTVRCQAMVSSSGPEALSRKYTIFKDGKAVLSKTSSSSEDLLYPIQEARVSNSGKYTCKINIEGKQLTSSSKKLTVTGLSNPVLHLNKGVVSEGEYVRARCTAPSETGSIFFYFYEDSREIEVNEISTNTAEVNLSFSSVGIHKIRCAYTVLVTPDSFKSERSNTITVSVKEISMMPVLEISPLNKVFEGDRLTISCSITNFMHSFEMIDLYLSKGNKLLSSGKSRVNHSMIALAEDPDEFECRLDAGNVVKVATKMVSVTELFSVPTLSMSPPEVFQRESMTLTCRSDNISSERLRKDELTYTLDPLESVLFQKEPGVFSGKTLPYEFNYTCAAEAKGIVKHSKTLTVRPKVSVSIPKISVDGLAVLGHPIKIRCLSDRGSPPINYTLLKEYSELSQMTVKQPHQPAIFTVSISSPAEIKKFMCEAKNSHRDTPLSARLNATVIVPLTHLTLTVTPDLADITEGDHLYLICGTDGTPPVTFMWYRVGTEMPIYRDISSTNHSNFQIPVLSKGNSGTYYCKAVNYAKNVVRSDSVIIDVRMALWKKVLIAGICLLAGTVLVVVLVVCFKSKRVKVNKAAVSVWSKRPPESVEDEESSVESNEPDVEYTEVVHPQAADPERAPLRKGTDTVYSELQNSPHGAPDHHDYQGSVEYAELNGEQPAINHFSPEVNNYQDLPEPVD